MPLEFAELVGLINSAVGETRDAVLRVEALLKQQAPCAEIQHAILLFRDSLGPLAAFEASALKMDAMLRAKYADGERDGFARGCAARHRPDYLQAVNG